MGYLNDPRELQIRPESGVTLEQDNRFEEMYHWGAAVLDLCNLPVDEYMRPMTVNIGEGGGGISPTPTVKTYTLKYYINGSVNKTITLAAGDEITQYTPSTVGYTFNGWYTDSRLTAKFTDTVMPERNVTVYGEMVPNEYVLAFYNETELISSANVAYNTNITYPNMPDKIESGVQYTFVWDDGIYNVMPNNDLDVYGHYEIVSTSDTFYYGVLMNSSLGNNLNGIESSLTEALISQIEPNDYYPMEIPAITDQEFSEFEEEWFDKFEEDDEFTENWVNNYSFSVVIVVPSDREILSVKQGDIDAVDWVGTNYETNYGSININGIEYNVYGYKTKNYYVQDDSKPKQIYIDIK
jgi:uncharacterized repeat protein (TIGR02543 family)